jgi:hypothetical protein
VTALVGEAAEAVPAASAAVTAAETHPVRVSAASRTTPAPRYHHHEWHAHAGDTRWQCECGAWVRELRTTAGFVIPLPKAAA